MNIKNIRFLKIITNYANISFILIIALCFFVIIYSVYRIYNPIYDFSLENSGINNFYYLTTISSIIVVLLSLIFIKILSIEKKINLTIIFSIIIIVLYGFEIYLEIPKKTEKEFAAQKLNLPYDKRTKKEVRDDLRILGIETLPNMHGYYWMEENGFEINNGRIYPIGTVSNSKTILHNQAGYYPVIETDEYGFHNPKGLYIKNKVDIMITGDSFAEGYAVHSNQNISAHLRKKNFNVITLGKGGNGPLLELATVKEYAEPIKPKIVLWFYFENDLSNLTSEVQSSILMRYFNEENFTQNLIERQDEIDKALMTFVDYKWKIDEEKQWERENLSNHFIIKIIKLYNLREKLKLIPTARHETSNDPQPWKNEPLDGMFVEILDKSKNLISTWNGKMYLVYLPAYGRYSKNFMHPEWTGIALENREFVLSSALNLQIPIIDIHKELFLEHEDPLSLFPLRLNGHYNSKGQELIAELINNRLKSDGY